MSTYKKLLQKRAELETRIEAARQAERVKIIQQLCETVAEYGLTADDIWRKGYQKGPGKVVMPARYLNSQTGQTWSGRGRTPAWIGNDHARFLIEK